MLMKNINWKIVYTPPFMAYGEYKGRDIATISQCYLGFELDTDLQNRRECFYNKKYKTLSEAQEECEKMLDDFIKSEQK